MKIDQEKKISFFNYSKFKKGDFNVILPAYSYINIYGISYTFFGAGIVCELPTCF